MHKLSIKQEYWCFVLFHFAFHCCQVTVLVHHKTKPVSFVSKLKHFIIQIFERIIWLLIWGGMAGSPNQCPKLNFV